MAKAEKYDPMIELLVACQMAGQHLTMMAGGLQERHNQEQAATETQMEGIEQAGHDVLKALAAFTSSKPAR